MSDSPEKSETSARGLFARRQLEAAAKQVQQELIHQPDDPETMLLAAKIEAARGNPQSAIELLANLDMAGPLAKNAAELRYLQSLVVRNAPIAHECLRQLRTIDPENRRWVDEEWKLLNLEGRRQEACEIAEQLCQRGIANESQLISLIRRTEAFPVELPLDQDPESFFYPGLGLARWFFTQQDYRRALTEFESNNGSASATVNFTGRAAAQALLGRLLAETQSYDRISKWHEDCEKSVDRFGDYWAALGIIFLEQGRYEGAARALLEAVYRNPTDRISFQRLARTFDSLGRPDDAAQFRHVGIQLALTERIAETLSADPQNMRSRNALSTALVDLYRPFEMLQWTESIIPVQAKQQREQIARQRRQLESNKLAISMAAEASQLEIDRNAFFIDQSMHEVFGELAKLAENHESIATPQRLAVPRLVNCANTVGVDFQWYKNVEIDLTTIPISESIGGGIAVIDFDLDGWPDVYFAQGSSSPPSHVSTRSNQLKRNQSGVFRDATQQSNTTDFTYSSGLAVGDVNADGFPDIFIGNLGKNRLLINNGDGTFADATERLGEHADTFTSSLAIADINNDSLPDLFECNYIEMEGAFAQPQLRSDGHLDQPSPLKHFPQADRWFQNQGNGRFAGKFIDDSTAKPATSLGIIVTDFNGDSRNEVFIGNDVRPNHLLTQANEGQFRNVADALGCANGFNGAATGCMGIATGDFNRDGRLDLHIANFLDESANLYLQNSAGTFVDAAVRYRISDASLPYVGFGTKSIDLDRNGWSDLLVTNGHIFDMSYTGEAFQMPPQCLMNMGDFFELTHVEDPSGYWDKEYLGRAMTLLDFDRDGGLDILIGHLDSVTSLLHNETVTTANWLQIELVGCASERDAIGAKVSVKSNLETLSQWVTAGDGYLSSDEAVIDFGLGPATEILSIRIDWPSGKRQTLSQVLLNRRYLVIENEADAFERNLTEQTDRSTLTKLTREIPEPLPAD